MYFLKTGSPAYLRWLRIFEPLMVITGIVQPLATLPSDFQSVFHAHPACFRAIIDNLVHLRTRKSIVGHIRPAQSQTGHLRRQHYRIGDECADGEWHPDECWMDLLRLHDLPIKTDEWGYGIWGHTWRASDMPCGTVSLRRDTLAVCDRRTISPLKKSMPRVVETLFCHPCKREA
jgi:hypothetical protein